MLEKEIELSKKVQKNLEIKIREEMQKAQFAILPVEEGIKKAKQNKTLLEAAKRLADK